MLRTVPKYKSVISIIPGGCIQFIDLGLNLTAFAKFSCAFNEVARPGAEDIYDLHCLELNEATQDYISRQNGQNADPLYSIKAEKAVEVYLDQWIPLPLLRRSGVKPNGQPAFHPGPANWARGRLTALPEPDRDGHSHRLTIALDTVSEPRPPGELYFALTPEDIQAGEEFMLADDERDNAWLLGQDWFDEWLYQLFYRYKSAQKRGRPLQDEDFEYACEHLARYLALLRVLAKSRIVPTLRLIDPGKYAPIEVDLIIDVGNSRTCGVLIETIPDAATTDLNNSYVLELRDLSRPEQIYREPFESRLEFSKALFGMPECLALSRRSGRRTEAFVWPTVVRVGQEAARLAAHSAAASGHTGMSSPKRYLWDLQPRHQEWRYNRPADDPQAGEQPVTSGNYVLDLNEVGTPLTHLKSGRLRREAAFRTQSLEPALRARYSRSSLMMFVLSELIMHALVTINSPAQRSERPHSDIPRRLRRVILTVPTAMPLTERKLFRRWAEWARDTLWESLGWRDWQATRRKGSRTVRSNDYREAPDLRADWDEASASQLVFLFNEITQKFQGDVRFLFRLYGRQRAEHPGRESLRIATLDIGGGTTALMITTYETLGEGATAVIRPHQLFREGFTIAGDDILRTVIERHVLEAIRQALQAAGVADSKALLNQLFGGDFGGQSELERSLRRQFATQVAMPIALRLLRDYEAVDFQKGNPGYSRSLRDYLPDPARWPTHLAAYVEQAARQAGALYFELATAPLAFDARALDRTVRSCIGPIVADLCEIVHLYDCDLLLLTGRPSRLPAFSGVARAKMPLSPERIIALHRYRVSNWYPYRDAHGLIADPKTTVVIGAMLCALAEGQLEAFSFRSSELHPQSTARFVGEMELSGQMLDSKVFFRELDLDSDEERELTHTFSFEAPLFIGFRQLAAERWPATPFYRLGFADQQAIANARGRLPYQVTVSFTSGPRNDAANGAAEIDEGEFKIEEVIAADGAPVRREELTLRLQTLRNHEGYWLDTGIFSLV